MPRESSKFTIGSHWENKVKILIKTQMLKSMDKLQGKKKIVYTYIKISGAWLPKEFNLKTGVDRRPAVKDHRRQESI